MPIYWFDSFEINCDNCGEKGSMVHAGEEQDITEDLYMEKQRLEKIGWIFEQTGTINKENVAFCSKECKEEFDDNF
jgi:hypothetical protein